MKLSSRVCICVCISALGLLLLAAIPTASWAEELHTALLIKQPDDPTDSLVINVPAGKSFEVITFQRHAPAGAECNLFLGNAYVARSEFVNQTPAGNNHVVLVGPCTLTMKFEYDGTPPLNDGDTAILTYRLKDAVTGGDGGVLTPASGNAVVIPTDAAGPVQIVLESSTDLITWTPASPGTYGASTTKRFFRVRAVQQ